MRKIVFGLVAATAFLASISAFAGGGSSGFSRPGLPVEYGAP
jgi:hypothetical protein